MCWTPGSLPASGHFPPSAGQTSLLLTCSGECLAQKLLDEAPECLDCNCPHRSRLHLSCSSMSLFAVCFVEECQVCSSC